MPKKKIIIGICIYGIVACLETPLAKYGCLGVGLKACISQTKPNLKPNLSYIPKFQSFHKLGYPALVYPNLSTSKDQNILLYIVGSVWNHSGQFIYSNVARGVSKSRKMRRIFAENPLSSAITSRVSQSRPLYLKRTLVYVFQRSWQSLGYDKYR